MTVSVAVGPFVDDALEEAITGAGGRVVEPGEADAVIWTDPTDPGGLGEWLATSPARWVQLPFAGIESFFAAGVIDPARTWTCAKGIYGKATAEHAAALILVASRRLHQHARAESWRSTTFGAPERRLVDRTVLIVGTGGIGEALVHFLLPFGTRTIGVNRSGRPLEGALATHPVTELPRLVEEADFLVLAAALTEETKHLVNAELLGRMKPDAWVVNVARGGLVDTDALVDALKNDTIAGAALDVTDPEPLPDDHPLWSLPNALITPHVANTWDMAVPELLALVRRNVARFVAGEELEGLVDTEAGY